MQARVAVYPVDTQELLNVPATEAAEYKDFLWGRLTGVCGPTNPDSRLLTAWSAASAHPCYKKGIQEAFHGNRQKIVTSCMTAAAYQFAKTRFQPSSEPAHPDRVWAPVPDNSVCPCAFLPRRFTREISYLYSTRIGPEISLYPDIEGIQLFGADELPPSDWSSGFAGEMRPVVQLFGVLQDLADQVVKMSYTSAIPATETSRAAARLKRGRD